jgi:hypothetical protein
MNLTPELIRKYQEQLKEILERVGPSKSKAKKMLQDDSAQGHALTDKQKKFFRAIAHGWKPTGKKKK